MTNMNRRLFMKLSGSLAGTHWLPVSVAAQADAPYGSQSYHSELPRPIKEASGLCVIGSGGVGSRLATRLSQGLAFDLLESGYEHDFINIETPETFFLQSGLITNNKNLVKPFDADTKLVLMLVGLGGKNASRIALKMLHRARESGKVTVVIAATSPEHLDGSCSSNEAGLQDIQNVADAVFVIDSSSYRKNSQQIQMEDSYRRSFERNVSMRWQSMFSTERRMLRCSGTLINAVMALYAKEKSHAESSQFFAQSGKACYGTATVNAGQNGEYFPETAVRQSFENSGFSSHHSGILMSRSAIVSYSSDPTLLKWKYVQKARLEVERQLGAGFPCIHSLLPDGYSGSNTFRVDVWVKT